MTPTPDRPIGVFLPVYNHAQYLVKSIPSILQQSETLVRLLVVDDASTDGSLGTIRSLAGDRARVEIVSKTRHGGIFDSHRIASEKLQTPYFYSAAADDWVLDGFFRKSLDLLERHPQAAFCCADCLIFKDGDPRFFEQRLGLGDAPRFVSPDEYRALIREREDFGFPCNAALLRRDCLMKVGGFRPELQWHSDWFALHTMAMRYGFCYLPEPLTVFRLAETGLSGNNPSKARERKLLFRSFFQILREPAYDDVRPLWRIPSILNPSRNARARLLKMALCNPGNGWLFSWGLVAACLRDRFRRPLWDALWFLVSPLSSRNFNALKLKLLKLFGAVISGTPQIQPCVQIECPWNLKLHDRSVLSRGVQIWAAAAIEIGPNAILDREVAIYSSGWDERTVPMTWKARPISVGKDASMGVRSVALPGAAVGPGESIPPMTVVR